MCTFFVIYAILALSLEEEAEHGNDRSYLSPRKLKLNSEYFAAEDIEFPTENSLKQLFSSRYLHVPDLHKLQSTKACPFLCGVSGSLSDTYERKYRVAGRLYK